MNIHISNSSNNPIYEQIYTQIKTLIINGILKEGEALPSMRFLAKELRISVITTKRAYEELERDGFIETVAGKGCFVGKANLELIREEHLKSVEAHLKLAIKEAHLAGLTFKELEELFAILFSDSEDTEC